MEAGGYYKVGKFLSACMVLSSSARLRRKEDKAKGKKEMSLYLQQIRSKSKIVKQKRQFSEYS